MSSNTYTQVKLVQPAGSSTFELVTHIKSDLAVVGKLVHLEDSPEQWEVSEVWGTPIDQEEMIRLRTKHKQFEYRKKR